MNDKQYKAIIEAILFTMGESVELEKIADAIELDKKKTKELIQEMKNELDQSDRGVSILELEGAYQMCTKPEMYDYLIKIAKQPKKHVLTDVLLETLSIIAYKQPVTRVEIEEIRGVGCDMMIKKLLARNLIRESGRLDVVGKPFQYEVTEEFMDMFKLASLFD